MKNVSYLLLFIMLVFFSGITSAQTVCSRVTMYTGPKSSSDLNYLLNNSTDPVIQSLTSGAKQSLVTYMVFRDGIVRGMSGTDQNIQAIYSDDSYAATLFTAIFGNKTMVSDYNHRPVVYEMPYDDFISKRNASPARYTGYTSFCKNCCFPTGGSTCCDPADCSGCTDNIILDTATGLLYRII